MYILAVDTASNAGGVALSRNSEVIGVHMAKTPLRYSERLLSWIDFLLTQHGIEIGEIGCFAVAAGPGSFTGLRVGVAAVKALAQVLGRPVAAVSSLEALAHRFSHAGERIAPVVDARRQQVYAGIYRRRGQGCEIVGEEWVGRPEEWLGRIPPADYTFVGDGAVLYRSTILSRFPGALLIDSDNCVLRELCRLAHQRCSQGLVSSAEQTKANYLRPPDVKMTTTDREQTGRSGKT